MVLIQECNPPEEFLFSLFCQGWILHGRGILSCDICRVKNIQKLGKMRTLFRNGLYSIFEADMSPSKETKYFNEYIQETQAPNILWTIM